MIEAIKKHKRIVAAVVILILTAVIELVCNFPAWQFSTTTGSNGTYWSTYQR